MTEQHRRGDLLSKVPQVTLMFWVIKICATTVGETGGDALSMTENLGYAVSSLIFLGFFGIILAAQVASKRYHPFVYWVVEDVIMGCVMQVGEQGINVGRNAALAAGFPETTVGTTMSDYLDRTLGLGYVKSSIMLFCGVLIVLIVWRLVTGAIEFENITTKTNEVFYWLTILVSNTLGTALGDFVATTTGLGFDRGALIFSGLLALAAADFRLAPLPIQENQQLLARGRG